MKNDTFAIKGDVLFCDEQGAMIERRGEYLICDAGKVAGVFAQLPEAYRHIPVTDCTGQLVIPGLVDLHLHAPQYAFRGLGMDLELLEWLDRQTFPEEAKYKDIAYAEQAYRLFAQDLKRGGTTRAAVFATAHVPATLRLMDMLEESGLVTRVGKVNMDRNAPDGLREESADASLLRTREWLDRARDHRRTLPILTPRFVPSCTDELMRALGALQRETGLPVQSHLSENPSEGAWVKELCPACDTYADAYLTHGLFGGEDCPTIMAHCVYSADREMELLAERCVWVAHSPISNACLSSGVAPVRAFMQAGVRMGLGSDIAGGYDISIFGVMREAIKDSKLRWRMMDGGLAPLTLGEAFFMATRGGGSFFGHVGAFDEGYEFDALVLSDDDLPCPFALTPTERLERIVYLGGDRNVAQKYVAGRRIAL